MFRTLSKFASPDGCDGLIEPTTDQQKVIADNLKGYILMPNISFIVSYKLN